MATNEVLAKALLQKQTEYRDGLNQLTELVGEQPEVPAIRWSLREAIELVGCLRRLIPECTVTQIHAAFGAPGDFGYDTPIGDALARTYGLL